MLYCPCSDSLISHSWICKCLWLKTAHITATHLAHRCQIFFQFCFQVVPLLLKNLQEFPFVTLPTLLHTSEGSCHPEFSSLFPTTQPQNSSRTNFHYLPQTLSAHTNLCDLDLRVPFSMSESRPMSLTLNPLLHLFIHR